MSNRDAYTTLKKLKSYARAPLRTWSIWVSVACQRSLFFGRRSSLIHISGAVSLSVRDIRALGVARARVLRTARHRRRAGASHRHILAGPLHESPRRPSRLAVSASDPRTIRFRNQSAGVQEFESICTSEPTVIENSAVFHALRAN